MGLRHLLYQEKLIPGNSSTFIQHRFLSAELKKVTVEEIKHKLKIK